MAAEQYIIPAPKKDMVVERVQLEELAPRAVRVKVAYAGVCHSDLHLWEGGYDIGHGQTMDFVDRQINYPVVPGHEISGHVTELGAGVLEADGVKVGDPVAVYPFIGCGLCPQCVCGRDDFCEAAVQRTLGYLLPGGYATHVTVPDVRYVVKVSPSVDLKCVAVATCSGLTAFSAISTATDSLVMAAKVRSKARILIVGCGGLGQWAVQLAVSGISTGLESAGQDANLAVYAADVRSDHLEVAKKLGAAGVVQWSTDAAGMDAALKRTLSVCGDKPDVIIDFVGSTATVSNSLKILQTGGLLVIVGLFGGSFQHPLPLIPLRSHRTVGIHAGSVEALTRLMKTLAGGKVTAPPIEVFGWGEVNTAMRELANGKLKGRAVIDPSTSGAATPAPL